MPNRKQHLRASKILLGYVEPLVHDILDRDIKGIEHRITHEPKTVQRIGDLLGTRAKTEAWLHIFLDYKIAHLPNLKKVVAPQKKSKKNE